MSTVVCADCWISLDEDLELSDENMQRQLYLWSVHHRHEGEGWPRLWVLDYLPRPIFLYEWQPL